MGVGKRFVCAARRRRLSSLSCRALARVAEDTRPGRRRKGSFHLGFRGSASSRFAKLSQISVSVLLERDDWPAAIMPRCMNKGMLKIDKSGRPDGFILRKTKT